MVVSVKTKVCRWFTFSNILCFGAEAAMSQVNNVVVVKIKVVLNEMFGQFYHFGSYM